MKAFLLAALCIGFPPIVGTASMSPTYTFKFRPPLHRKLHYTMRMQTGGAALTMKFSTTAVSFSAGKYTLVTTYDSMNVPGVDPAQVNSQLANARTTQVVSESGKILKTSSTGVVASIATGGVAALSSLMPAKPVHVGDSWSSHSALMGKKSVVHLKLVKVVIEGGHQLAVLELTSPQTGPGKTGPIRATIEPATGIFHTMSLSGSNGSTEVSVTVRLD